MKFSVSQQKPKALESKKTCKKIYLFYVISDDFQSSRGICLVALGEDQSQVGSTMALNFSTKFYHKHS